MTIQTLLQDLSEVREKGTALRAKLKQVMCASAPYKEAIAQLNSTLDRLSAGVDFAIGFMVSPEPRPESSLTLPRPETSAMPNLLPVHNPVGANGSDAAPAPFVSVAPQDPRDIIVQHGLLALLCRERLTQLMTEKIDTYYETHEPGLPAAERAARVLELRGEILESERREEDLIRQLEAEGHDVDRRADTDPAIVLDAVFEATA